MKALPPRVFILGEELVDPFRLLGRVELGATAALHGYLTPKIARRASERVGRHW